MSESKFVFQSFDKESSESTYDDKKIQKTPETEQVDAVPYSKTAVALAYDPDKDAAPRVIASGRGVLAEKILQTAKHEQIPIHKDAPLAKTLSNLEIGENIPPELYEVVAEILLFVDRMDRWKEKMENGEK